MNNICQQCEFEFANCICKNILQRYFAGECIDVYILYMATKIVVYFEFTTFGEFKMQIHRIDSAGASN